MSTENPIEFMDALRPLWEAALLDETSATDEQRFQNPREDYKENMPWLGGESRREHPIVPPEVLIPLFIQCLKVYFDYAMREDNEGRWSELLELCRGIDKLSITNAQPFSDALDECEQKIYSIATKRIKYIRKYHPERCIDWDGK